jgi:hypothetical protein
MQASNWISICALAVAIVALGSDVFKSIPRVTLKTKLALNLEDRRYYFVMMIINHTDNPFNIVEYGFYAANGYKVFPAECNPDNETIEPRNTKYFPFSQRRMLGLNNIAKQHGTKMAGVYIRDSEGKTRKAKIKNPAIWFETNRILVKSGKPFLVKLKPPSES